MGTDQENDIFKRLTMFFQKLRRRASMIQARREFEQASVVLKGY